eukprot:CAMPEP_0206264306 /NCGR_PEP_ID=MMETSP0047_2-20121206/29322_1 /ASSEMBLY_ACC=CAM_ASM_000192 /TAXON_ID=195065 /ORGANISM="Chroomonas mesostigmatica_cf, Strain CCMP1168" /LENGTH=121 /DNA_ID=CAMNT_0053691987 /DNA_START=66 /DNA_END=428 /DNA_ORIENTATION=+
MSELLGVGMKRLSRFFVNKKLLHGLLEEELEEAQCEVRVREEEVVLRDVKLRADALNALLPPSSRVSMQSVSIDTLTVKLPSLVSSWSFSSDVTPVAIIASGLEVILQPCDGEAPEPTTPA